MRTKPRNEYFRMEPGNAEVTNIDHGKFCLTFEGRTKSGGTKRCVVELDLWWVQHLARELWKIPKRQREQLDANERALRGGQ